MEPQPHDVICNKETTSYKQTGNTAFLKLVMFYKPLYVSSSKVDKKNIAKKIVQAILKQDPPGRFLELDESGSWEVLNEEKCVEKCIIALREGSVRRRSSSKKAKAEILKKSTSNAKLTDSRKNSITCSNIENSSPVPDENSHIDSEMQSTFDALDKFMLDSLKEDNSLPNQNSQFNIEPISYPYFEDPLQLSLHVNKMPENLGTFDSSFFLDNDSLSSKASFANLLPKHTPNVAIWNSPLTELQTLDNGMYSQNNTYMIDPNQNQLCPASNCEMNETTLKYGIEQLKESTTLSWSDSQFFLSLEKFCGLKE